MLSYSSKLRRSSQVLAVAFAATLLSACEQPQRTQDAPRETAVDWARAALQRNPNLELVATDTSAQVFTVRDKQTGEVRVVKLDELAAAPVASLGAGSSAQPRTEAPSTPSPAPEQPAHTAETAPPSEPAATTKSAPSTAADANTPGYTIERSDGQVRVSGPGVSIVSSSGSTGGDAMGAQQNAVEPIICEGQRMVHFDNRQIYVEGDAITVRGGCEMYITNSRIVATGTGIVVQDGVVHVSNSHIEGVDNSFDADSRAKVFVRASTFRGLPRRSELALVQDQGGNRWR